MSQIYVSDPSPALVFYSLFPPSSSPPRYARHTHIHHLNQRASPLLRLPPEIRTLIWQHLLALSPVHLTWSTTKGLVRCGRCFRRQTPEGHALPPTPPCLHGFFPPAPPPASPTLTPSRRPLARKSPSSPLVSTLLVSRHMHAEISSLIFSAAPIQIDSPYAFYAFFKHLQPHQRAHIASLHLLCESASIEPPAWNPTRLSWNRVLHGTLLAQFAGLRELEISIVSQQGAWRMSDVLCFPGAAAGANVVLPRKSRGFLRFRGLGALRSVRARTVALGVGSHAPGEATVVELGNLGAKILGTLPLTGDELDEAGRIREDREGLVSYRIEVVGKQATPRKNLWRV